MAINFTKNVIGVLDSTELTPQNYVNCLSAGEVEQFSLIRNLRRKHEWLAGRLSAKFLFLSGADTPGDPPAGELRLFTITHDTLAQFDSAAYRNIEVIRNSSPAGGPPQISWVSGTASKSVAISHTAGLACALLGSGATFSVDIETCHSRVPEFRQHNFTSQERAWVDFSSYSSNIDSDWLYTLLWSAKECLLKTPMFEYVTLWDLPSLEVSILTASDKLSAIHRMSELGERFLELDVRVNLRNQMTGQSRSTPLRIAVSGTPNLVLTAITQLNGITT